MLSFVCAIINLTVLVPIPGVLQAMQDSKCAIIKSGESLPKRIPDYLLWLGDVEDFLNTLPNKPIFDLVVTSPPYNIRKPYEEPWALQDYLTWQKRIIEKTVGFVKPSGSICWQVGNHVIKGRTTRGNFILPLDIELHPIFQELGLKLRNRIIWTFGHGLHCKYRFSGRYETIMWYTKSDEYVFNLDNVRIDPKYPGKKRYKGPRKGEYSCHPMGKNPEDVWEIPNVKSNHVEKTIHPCQFPVALIVSPTINRAAGLLIPTTSLTVRLKLGPPLFSGWTFSPFTK